MRGTEGGGVEGERQKTRGRHETGEENEDSYTRCSGVCESMLERV